MFWVLGRTLRQGLTGYGLLVSVGFALTPLFEQVMMSPPGTVDSSVSKYISPFVISFSYVLPIIASWTSLQAFLPELTERFTSLVALRDSLTRYMWAKYFSVSAFAILLFFSTGLFAFWLSFFLLPALGIFEVSPQPTLPLDFLFGDLVESQPFTFGLVYSGWLALHAWIWSSICFACLLLVKNRFAALLTPMVFYFVSWLFMANTPFREANPRDLWVLASIPDPNIPTYIIGTAVEIVVAATLTWAAIRQFAKRGFAE